MLISLRYEQKFWRRGYMVAGVDEVGRGAWAGPLVAAAVIVSSRFKKKPWHNLVNDSKTLTPRVRNLIFESAQAEVVWALGFVDGQTIDRVGITIANQLAVRRAVQNLPQLPGHLITDFVAGLGQTIAGVPTSMIVKGDGKVFSIALASIIAKVQRDKVMAQYELSHPGYGFAQHKGYGTREHAKAIKKLGPSPIHRLSYRPLRGMLL